MAVTVGSVHVDVVPSTENFITRMKREILGEADKLGRELGERIGRQVADAAASEVAEGIEDGVEDANSEAAAGKKGREAGGRFAREFRARITAALNDLPTVDLEVDDSELTSADRQLKELRKSLETLRGKKIDADFDGDEAFAAIAALRAQLQTLRDGSIEVDFDIDSAERQLGELQRTVARDIGGTFDNTLRTSLSNAVKNLPKIDLDADPGDAQRALAAIRTDMVALSELADFELDLDADFALAEIAELRARLQELVDDETLNIKVRTDAAAAIGQLEAIEAMQSRLNRGFDENEREAGAFVRKFRADIDALLRTIPDIEINADTSPARRALNDVRTDFAALRDLEIGVDVDTADALRQLGVLEGVLEGLVNDADVEVRFIARQALAEAVAFRSQLEATLGDVTIGVEVEARNPGAFATKLRADLARIQASLPDFEIGANLTPAQTQIAVLRRQIGTLSATININSDMGAVMAQIAALQARLATIKDVDVNVKVDIANAIADLAALAAASTAAGAAADNASGRFSRWRLILAAVLLLFPLIAGAIVGLAGAIALIATPILAVAAGFDGIKAAIAPLKDELDSLRAAVSGAFEQGLATAVTRAAAAFPVFSAGLAGTASVLSEVTDEILRVITSSENLSLIATNFELVNNVIRSLAPSLGALAQNFTDFVTIGAQGMSTFGIELSQVGDTWARVIARLSGDSGTGQAAVRAFFQVFAELLGLLGPLTEFGAVLLATFGPALSAALGVLSGLFEAFSAVLSAMPGPLQTVATAAILVSTALLILGRSGAGIALAFANIFAAAVTGAGGLAIFGAAMRGVLAVLGGPVGAIIIGVVTALSFLGQGQSAAAQEAAAHQSAIQALGDALEQNNGVIDDSIRAMTAKTIIDSGASDSARALGISMEEITDTVSNQGPAFDELVARLEGYAAAGRNASTITSEQGDEAFYAAQGTVAHGTAAQSLLDIIVPLGEEFRVTAENLRLYQEATGQAVTTSAVGVANAAALSEAIGVLGLESSTTADKVKALDAALNALNGGVLTADEAAAALRESIAGIGKAFEEAQAATAEAGVSLVMANGAIDNTTEAGRALGEELSGVRDGMIESATAAFDAAGGLGNIEAASAAAAGEVQFARDAFMEAALAAGLNATEAQNLANRYGLIPSLVTTLLRAEGLPLVNQDLITLSQRLDGIPAGKTVNVGILAEETKQVLRDLGIQIETLPGGEVIVTATDQTKPAIDNILGFIADQNGVMPVLGDTTPVTRAAQIERERIASEPGRLPVELNRDGVGVGLTLIAQDALNTVVTIPVDANDSLVRSKMAELIANVNASVGLVNIDGKIEPASVALQTIVAAINNGQGFVQIDGNDVPVGQALNDVMALIASSTASVEINGQNLPASQVLSDTLAAIAAGSESVTIGGIDMDAQSVLAALLGDVAASSAAIKVLADAAAANAAIDNAARARTAVITVVTTGANAANVGNSGLNSNSGQARGNYLVPMARGGVLGTPLTPMAARANKIAPNTWRVIGDNMKVPEVYAPLDGSARSLSFLRAGVQSYGLDVTPMATGGLIASALQLTDRFVRQPSAQQARPLGSAGALATQNDAANGLGTDRVETKLDEIAQLLRSSGNSSPASITVNDQSGNPVETARAMQLALRMAR